MDGTTILSEINQSHKRSIRCFLSFVEDVGGQGCEK
jgi:hypothetical protein